MIQAVPCEEVLQIRLSRYAEFPPAATVSVYWVDGLLIDSGPAHTAEELVRFLDHHPLRLVFNTHYHEDHIGANQLLKDRFGVEIFAPPLSVDPINRPARLYPYQEEVWGYPVPSRVSPLEGTLTTERFRFEIIPTPGHDRDHACLYQPERGWVFSGDLYVGSRPVVCRPMDDQWQILEDLKRIRALRPRILFPAPTRVIFDPGPKLDQIIAHLESLGESITRLHRQGLDVSAIRQRVFGEENPIALMTQGQFSSENMVKSFLKRSLSPA